jgi:stalled ribosome rescue protein Dom34
MEFNRIHTLQNTIRQQVEHKIRKLRMGEVPWSLKLQVFRDHIKLWSCFHRTRLGLKMSNKKIRWLLTQVDVGELNIYELSTAQVEARMKSAFKFYKEAKKDASMWRNDFLHELAASRAEKNGTTVEHGEATMRKIERQRWSARNVKRMRGKLQRSATNKVYVAEVIDGVAVRCCVTEKLDIEQVAARENDSRFGQSENTPLMQEPLLSELGYLGNVLE